MTMRWVPYLSATWGDAHPFFLALAPIALVGCGARTGLNDPAPCLVSSTAPGATHACASGTTNITGTVYDPAGKEPLYNVVVYVPSSTPQPIIPGATCDSCSALYTGNPIATALTDADGHFFLRGVPDGPNIPLVLQVGKWRRQLTLPNVVACEDNPQPDGSLSLPRNHFEGDIPNIAISTGGADTLECLFLRLGLDASEYGGGANGAGRIHVFQGAGRAVDGGGMGGNHAAANTVPPGPRSYEALWDSNADIFHYDMVFLSCEGEPTTNMNQQVLFDYAAGGGRVFAEHFHYAWLDSGPFGQANLATWAPNMDSMEPPINATIVATDPNGQPFAQGAALAHWLAGAGALTAGHELPIVDPRYNAHVGAMNTASQPWIVADQKATSPGATQYFSFDTPLGAAPVDQCGQVVFTDIHVGAASHDDTMVVPPQTVPTVPTECANGDLSPQEKALEFLVFNLSSCVTPTGQAPAPPPACVRAGN
jgi:hypothetical protein